MESLRRVKDTKVLYTLRTALITEIETDGVQIKPLVIFPQAAF